MGDLVVPKLGLTVTEVEVVGWLVDQGATVRAGDPVIELNADKADVVVEALADGVLAERFAQEGDVVAVGGLLGRLELACGVGSDGVTSPVEPIAIPRAEHRIPADLPPAALTAQTLVDDARPNASSPAARRLAAERGVALDSVVGTGPGGRVVERDVPELGLGSSSDFHRVSEARPNAGPRPTGSAGGVIVDGLQLSIEVNPAAMDRDLTAGRSLGLPLRHVHLVTAVLSALANAGRVPRLSSVGWRTLIDPPGQIRGVAIAATAFDVITAPPTSDGVDAVVIDLSDTSVSGLPPSGAFGNAVTVGVSKCRDKVVAIDGGIAVRPRLTLAVSWTGAHYSYEEAVSMLETLARSVEQGRSS